MTIDFNRRTLAKAATILSASLGAPMLAGCSGPQHHADNRMMPGTVFTPEALKATAKGKTYVRDFVAVYGRPLRRMNDHVPSRPEGLRVGMGGDEAVVLQQSQ